MTAVLAALPGALAEAHAAVDLHDVDARRPADRQRLGDLVQGAAPTDAEQARHRSVAHEVIGGGF